MSNPGEITRQWTLVYLPNGKPLSVENLKSMPLTCSTEDKARDMLQLLHPGALVVGIHTTTPNLQEVYQ